MHGVRLTVVSWIMLLLWTEWIAGAPVGIYHFTAPRVDNVTVFGNNLAIINRSVHGELLLSRPGIYKGIIADIPATHIIEKSPRVLSLDSGIEILDVSITFAQEYSPNYSENQAFLDEVYQRLEEIELEIQRYNKAMNSLDLFISSSVARVEVPSIVSSVDMTGESLKSAENVSELFAYEASTREKLTLKGLDLLQEKETLNQRIKNLESASTLNGSERLSPNIVIVFTFRVSENFKSLPVRFDSLFIVNYVVAHAGWVPTYDIHILPLDIRIKGAVDSSSNQPPNYHGCAVTVALWYNAFIWLYSTHDWLNSQLSLSTSQPNDLDSVEDIMATAMEGKGLYFEGNQPTVDKQSSKHRRKPSSDRYNLMYTIPSRDASYNDQSIKTSQANDDAWWDDDDNYWTFNDKEFLDQTKGLEKNRHKVRAKATTLPLSKSVSMQAAANKMAMATIGSFQLRGSNQKRASVRQADESDLTRDRVRKSKTPTSERIPSPMSPESVFRLDYRTNITAIQRSPPMLVTTQKRQTESQNHFDMRPDSSHRVFLDFVSFQGNLFVFACPSVDPSRVLYRLMAPWPEGITSTMLASRNARVFMQGELTAFSDVKSFSFGNPLDFNLGRSNSIHISVDQFSVLSSLAVGGIRVPPRIINASPVSRWSHDRQRTWKLSQNVFKHNRAFSVVRDDTLEHHAASQLVVLAETVPVSSDDEITVDIIHPAFVTKSFLTSLRARNLTESAVNAIDTIISLESSCDEAVFLTAVVTIEQALMTTTKYRNEANSADPNVRPYICTSRQIMYWAVWMPPGSSVRLSLEYVVFWPSHLGSSLVLSPQSVHGEQFSSSSQTINAIPWTDKPTPKAETVTANNAQDNDAVSSNASLQLIATWSELVAVRIRHDAGFSIIVVIAWAAIVTMYCVLQRKRRHTRTFMAALRITDYIVFTVILLIVTILTILLSS